MPKCIWARPSPLVNLDAAAKTSRKLRETAASPARIPVRAEDSLGRLLDLWHPSSPGVNQDDDVRTIPSAHLSGP